jgi:hypothetical protein
MFQAIRGVPSPGHSVKGTRRNGSLCIIPDTIEDVCEEYFFITESQNNPAIMVRAGINAHKEPRLKE